MAITRRAMLASSATALAAAAARAQDPKRDSLGLVIHSFPVRIASDKGFAEPVRYLDYCRSLGARTVQLDLGARTDAYADALRARAAEASMSIEASISPPRGAADLERFEAEIRTAKRAGASIVRTVLMRGRRYEILDSAAGFERYKAEAIEMLTRAAPVIERHDVRLAVENHKDCRAAEMIALLDRVKSERIGVCVDTGNSISLLEDPIETVETLAPRAFSSHLKDMAVEEYKDGFLLSEVAFGTGVVDLPRIVGMLQKANPAIRFQIEMITRDPLKIPCLTDRYWATFPDLSGRHLARMLSYVRAHAEKTPLPRISPLAPADRLKAEDDNIRISLAYCRDRLGL